ncbi:hypothetical protein BASA82_001262 [Batrachochytrium salamandrivorans]|nr:hypothetical protein BASA82_001262 [Batrachochytrium salamandrivorans]
MANSDISVSLCRSSTRTINIYYILDIRPCSRLDIITSAPFSLQSWVTRWSMSPRSTPYHKTRCSIPHNGPRRPTTQHIQRLSAKARKPTGVFGKTTDIAVQTSLDQQPHLHHYHGRSSQSMLPTSATNVLLSAISSGNTRLWAISETCITHLNFALLPGSMSSSIQPRDLDAEESPSVSHRALVAMNMFSGSQITRLSTVHGRRHSSIDHFVCNAPARALLTSPRVDRQTAVADHFVIRTSPSRGSRTTPCSSCSNHIPTSFHSINRRLLSGTTKRAILASNTARQAFIAAATHTNPDPVQCNTLRDEWSRLKATATQLERVDGRKQWVKHADNLDRAVSDGRTDLVFSAARAMSGNSSRSAAVTPLYNSDGIVQYDPTSILRVMQGHYGSLAADTTGHSLDLQYWHDRQPIQVSLIQPSETVTFSTRISRGIRLLQPFCR